MKFGITYRGRHSSELGLIAKVITKPAAPPVRVVEETVPYRDGTVDYSESGGRLFYDDKVMEIEFKAVGSELSKTELLISKAVAWLMGGWGDLILDSAPLTKWIAKPVELSEIATELYRVGSFTVQFRCRPFNQLVFGGEGVCLDAEITLDSLVPLGFGSFCHITGASGSGTALIYGDTAAELTGIRLCLTDDREGAEKLVLTVCAEGDNLQYILDTSDIKTDSEIFIDIENNSISAKNKEGESIDVSVLSSNVSGFDKVRVLNGACWISADWELERPPECDISLAYTPLYFYVNSELEVYGSE